MAYCLICYRSCDNPAQICNEKEKAKVKSDTKKFLKLLERYINGGKNEGYTSTIFPKEVMEGGIITCQNCYNLLENFYDIYNVLEETEMILNWKLKCLAGIMECCGDNNMVKDLENGADDVAKAAIEWRRMIAAKCNKKIQRSFPRLTLKRGFEGNIQNGTTTLKGPQTTLPKNVDTQTANNITGIIVGVSAEINLPNLRNEVAFTSHEQDCNEYDPSQLSSESSSTDSEDDLENIKEESNFAPTSEGITEEIFSLDDFIEEDIKHSTMNCEMEADGMVSKLEKSTTNDQIQEKLDIKSNQRRKHICPVCSTTFKDKRSIKNHYYKAHNRQFICRICGITMSKAWNLMRHNLLHTGENPFHCKLCDQKFYRKDALNAHIKSWHGKKRRKDQSSKSLKIHADQRPSTNEQSDKVIISIEGNFNPTLNNNNDNLMTSRRAEGPSTNENQLAKSRTWIPLSENFMISQVTNEPNVAITTGPVVTEALAITEPDALIHLEEINSEINGKSSEHIASTSPAATNLSQAPGDSLIDCDFANEFIATTTSETIAEETPQTNLHTNILINEAEAERCNEEGDLSRGFSNKEPEGFALTRTLRRILSCPNCSKTFSTAQKLQAHLTSHLNDEEISSTNQIMYDDEEDDCDEYNPEDISVDESESSSSESESGLKNNKEEAIESSKDGILLTKTLSNDIIEDFKLSEYNQHNDLVNIKEESEEAVTPTNTQPGKLSQDELRKKYKADSDIVEFLTFPCEIEGCTEILHNSKDFEDHKGHHGTFTCSLCPTTFSYAPHLARHELSKHCEENLKCPREECNFKGKDARKYNHHVLVSHLNLKLALNGRRFTCKICKQGFGDMGKLRRHFSLCRITNDSANPNMTQLNKELHILRKRYKKDSDIVEFLTIPCQVEGCIEIIFSSNDFEDHQTHHGTFTCEICSKSFHYAPNLARHELSEHCNGTKKCPREGCAFERREKYLYTHHVLTHHLKLKNSSHTRKFNCKICKTGFGGIKRLRAHFKLCRIAKLSTKPRVKCDVEGCTGSFKNAKLMTAHKRLMHFNGAKPICQICKEIFANKAYLNLHMIKSHQKDLKIHCVVKSCKTKFLSEISRDFHVIKKHENEKDKISKLCPHCGKKFMGCKALQIHLDSLERPKGYICETCGKGFRHRDQLDVHKLYHSGPDSWQYQCEICAKKCISKSKLEEHKRTHENAKPFVCDTCGAKYAHRHNLRIHVNNKHKHLKNDVARLYDKDNLTSKKGMKRKNLEVEEENNENNSSDSSN